MASSPFDGLARDTTLKRASVYDQVDPVDDGFDQDYFFPSDQPIDLGLDLEFGNGTDLSYSQPSPGANEGHNSDDWTDREE